MSDTGSPINFDELVRSIDSQSEQVRLLRQRTEVKVAFMLVGLVVAIVLAAISIWVGLAARHALTVSEQERVNRGIASCNQANDFYEKHNALIEEDKKTLQIAFRGATSESAKQFLADRLAAYEKDTVTLRDCSPKGIEKYLR